MGSNIAILTPTFDHHSGIDHVVEMQAEDLVKKGNKVTVMALEASIIPQGYNVVELGLPKNPFWQRMYRLFFFLDTTKSKYYKKLKSYDIVISHFYPMNVIASKAKKKYDVRYIYHNHGINTNVDGFFEKLYMKLFLMFSNSTLRNVDEAYSVSKFLQKELAKQTGIRSKVRYNPIDKKYNTKAKDAFVRKKYKLAGKKVVLYVGRLAPYKRIHHLIKAAKQLSGVVFIIVGKATYASYYRNLKALAPKNVIFTGFVKDEDLISYYAACNLYVTASKWEGFNLPAAEVQACGKPMVAYRVGSHPEIVKKGTLVEDGDVASFTNAIKKHLKL